MGSVTLVHGDHAQTCTGAETRTDTGVQVQVSVLRILYRGLEGSTAARCSCAERALNHCNILLAAVEVGANYEGLLGGLAVFRLDLGSELD